MSSARAGAATVLLQDGRLLITGGDNGTGAVTSADIFDKSGSFSPAAAMNNARIQHTATVLQDGTVLVAGGLSGGVATNTAEIYSPATGAWTPTSGLMNQARSGHTATLLSDGTVLIAGGDNVGIPQSGLEIYNPTTGTFSPVNGSLSSPRELHAAAVLQSGQVIILGGFDGTQALATTDIYDPSSGTVSAGPPMSIARQNFTATTQLDGKVLAAGGNNGVANGSQDLGTAEIYDPSSGIFSLTGNLVIARQGHQAFLLPHNGTILITGGTAPVNGNEASIANAELYYPLETGLDASPSWSGTFVPTGSMAAARSYATGGSPSNGTPESTNDGFFLAAGGKNATGTALSSSELYGFAWIKTDATDYAPGTTVNITGGGFQPGETVTLHFQEVPYYDSHPDLTAVADTNGDISNSQFAPDVHDIDIRFYLTATGSTSGALAQTTFTDNKTLTVSFTGSGSGSVTSSPTGISCTDTSGVPSGTCSESVANTATITLTATPSSPSSIGTWSLSSGTVNSGCTSGSTTCTVTLSNSNATVTVSFNPGPVSAATSTFVANPTSVTANGTSSTTLTVTLKDSGGNPVGNKSVSLSQGSGLSSISPASATTNAAGVATFTATDTTVEAVTYTGKDTTDNITLSQTATVNYTVGPVSASASTVVASPTSVVADGSTTSTITVTLFDSLNHPVSGKTVTLAQGTGHSTISPLSATTNASGIATFTVKNTKAETDTYTATDSTDSITITQTAQVTFTAGAVSPSVSTVSANPTLVPADGATSSTITVTLLDANSNPISGKAVSLSAGSGGSIITTLSGTTNASGQATFSVKDTVVEAVTYSGKDTTDAISIAQTASVNFTVGPVSATTSTVSASPTTVVADGVTTSTVTVTLLDASSRPVSGKTVTLSAGSGSSTITTVNGTTNANGQATFTVKDTKAETVAYTGKDTTDSVTVTQTAQVTFTAGTPTAGNSTVTANPTSITADGSTTSTITVTLEDAHNNPVSGKTVTLQGTGSSTITAVNGTTNASGVATFTVKNTKAETDTYTATDTSDTVVVTQTAQVTFTPGALTKFVFATISSPQTAGTAFNVTITAEDANGNTVTSYNGGGDNVTISSTGTIQGGSFTSNNFSNGALTQSVTITNTGNFTLTATGNPGHASGIIGTSNPFTVNPGTATHFTVSAPGSATAGAPINFTVTALDAFNNTATGYLGTVRFLSTDGQAALPANYPFAAGDNGIHVFSATLKTAGSQTISATDVSNGTIAGTSGTILVSAGTAASITATAGTPQSATINTAFAINLAATVKDAYGNPVGGVVVTLATPGSGASGSFAAGANTATTNSSGVATAAAFTANSTAGSYNVTASVSGVASQANFSLTNNNPAPTLTSISPTSGLVTQTLNVTLTGSNYIPGVTTVSFGADITVNSVTVNSGTQITANITIPSGATLGAHTVSATNPAPGGGTASLAGAFDVIGTPPQITSMASTTFTAGVFGSFTVMTSGNPTPSLSESGSLPSGVTFSDNGNGTATISGTTTLAKSYSIIITAQNGVSPNATQNFTLTVNPGPLASLTLSPSSAAITAGGNQTYTAQGFDQYLNSRGDVTRVTTFSVTNGICTVNSCSSTVAGTQTVTGNDGGIMGTATLMVNPGAITRLVLNPNPSSITAGASQSYTAAGYDTYGNLAGDVTSSTNFTIAPNGSCTGANCTTNIADVNGSSHTVTGMYTNGAVGTASLTVNPGIAAQLQVLIPGETAAPGSTTGKTGTPNTEYVNGQFNATVNAVDQYWNVVTTVNDTVHISSNDANALVPADSTLVSGTGVIAVTLESVSYPATTTLTASDVTIPATNSSTSAAIPVIVVYTASISPADWATGQAATYTLTINNSPAPNANNLASVEVAVPGADQGTIGNVTVTATEPGGVTANWSYDTSLMPGMMRFSENTANDAVTPGGVITISFMASSSAQVSSSVMHEVWNTTAYSDSASKNPLPLAPPEPTVQIGAAPQITSASSTNAFTYGISGTEFTVTTTGFPKPTLSESGSFPAWATFTDNHDGTATISGTPSAAGSSTFTITAHNGYGNDATQSFTLTVNKATVTPSITASDKVYDGTASATVICTLTGVPSQDSTNVSCSPSSASFSQAGAGNNLTVTATGITLSGPAAGNYQLSVPTATTTANILPKTLMASITAASKPYDGTMKASVTCSLSGVVMGDSVSCTAASASFSSANAGTWTVTATGITLGGASFANYQLASNTATTSATITQATPAVNVVGGTFGYDGNAHGASAAAIGVGGAMVSGTFAFTYTPPGNMTVPVNAGAYNVSAAFSSADPNYSNAAGMGSLTINQAQASASAANASRPYGQANPVFTGTLTGFVPADGISATFSSAATLSTPVGTYGPASSDAIVPTLVDPNNKLSNYVVTSTNGSLTITAVPLLVVSPDNARAFGVADSPLTPTLVGLVAGDTAATVGNPMCQSTASSTSAPGSYAIVCSGVTSTNYSVIYVNGTLTITDPLNTIAVTPNPATLTYGGSTTFLAQGIFASSASRTLANAGGEAYELHDLSTARIGAAGAEAKGKLYAIGGTVSGTPSNTVEVYDPSSDSWSPVANLNYARTSARAASVAGKIYVFGGCSDVACTSPVSTGEVYDPASNLWSAISATGFTPRSSMAVGVVNDQVYVAGGSNSSGTPLATVEIYNPGTNSWSTAPSLKTALGPASGGVVNGNFYVVGIVSGHAEVEEFSSSSWSTVNTGIQPLSDVGVAVLNNVLYVIDGANVHAYDPVSNAWTNKNSLNSPRMQPEPVAIGNLIYLAGNTASGATDPNSLEAFASDEATWSSSDATVASIDQTGKTTALKVGNTSVTATSIEFPTVSGSSAVTVNPAQLTITASTNSKTYDSTTSAVAIPAVSGLQFTDTVTNLTESYTDKNAGPGKTLVVNPGYTVNDGNNGNNYTVQLVNNTTGVILQAPLTISAVANSKTYDATTSAAAVPTTSGLQGSDSVTGLTESYSDKNAGTGKTLSVSPGYTVNDSNGGKNYIVTTVNNTSGVILQAPLTISAVANSKTYDATTSALAIPTTSGLQGSDTVTGLTESYADKNAGTGKTLSVSPGYTVNDGNGGKNYIVTTVTNTSGVILQAPLTISAVANSKTYDATTNALAVPTTSGLQGSDTVTGLTESYTDKNAGLGKTLTVNPGYTVNDGNSGKNYIVNTTNNTGGVILQAPLTISAITNTKTYDATTGAAAIPTTSGQQGSDSVSGLTESYTDKSAGTGKTLVVNPGYTVNDGNGGKNYIVTAVNSTSGVILQAPLTISAAGVNKEYDGTTAATVTLSDNHISGDTVVDNYTSSTFSDKNVGSGKLVTVTGISISGADAPNYTFNTTATTTANITQRPLLISATGINKIYDSTVNATVTLSDNRVSPDVLSETYTSASFLDANVGVGKTVNVNGIAISGTDAPNYTYNTTAITTANISPASLTVTASSGSMTYGSAPFVDMPIYAGFLGKDGPSSLTSGMPVCGPLFSPTSAPGSYPTSCTAPTPNGNYALTFVGGNVIVSQASSSTSVTSSVNPSTFMQMVTFTATIADSSSGSVGMPTGTVTFSDTYNGNTTALCTTTLVVANNGQVTCSTSSLGDQYPNNITVSYSGDTNFLPSSTASPLVQNASPAPVVTLNPMYLSFGNQNVNTSSKPALLTLTNIGDAPLNISTGGISITGTNATEFAETATCGSTVAANGGNCTISVTFTPAETGVATASLQIADNDDDGGTGTSQIVSLTGAGLSTIAGTSLYTDGLFATASSCGSITVSGGSTADSFNSALGYSSSHQLSGGNVGTNGNVNLNGSTSAIYGSAAVDSLITGNCSKSSMTGLTTSGKAQVTGGLVALNGPISYPTPPTPNPAPPTTSQSISGSCPTGMTGCSKGAQGKSVVLAPGQYGNVTISGGTTAYVSQGNYVFNSLSLNGNSILYVESGPVAISLAGASMSGSNPALDLSGGSIENPSGIPSNLQFSYAGSRGVNLSGGSGAYATMYAPNALVNMSGGSDFFGSIIASTITNSGGTAMHYDTSLPNIGAGNYIWFSAVVNNVKNLGANQVKLYLTNSSINFTANGTAYNVPVPNAVITFNSASAGKPITSYDLTNNRWSTSIPSSGLTGNTFVTGMAFPVPVNFPGGIQNVSWSAAFSTDTPGVTLQWQWGAAVYTSLSTAYATSGSNNVLQVNPEDGTADQNSTDPAGTPETYKSSVTFGGTGGGLTNYSGFLSTGAGVVPTIAPMSVSPSSLDFGSQTQGTTSTQMTAVLTNNDSAGHNITGISLSGTNAGDFVQTNNCLQSPPTSPTLASGGNCTFTVTFTPGDIGTRTAKIVITSDANNSPQSVYLTGAGH